MQFYVYKNDKQLGPLPLLEVRERLKKGELDYSDLAWRDGLQDWTSLRELMGGALPDATPNSISGSAPVGKKSGSKVSWLIIAFVILVGVLVAIGLGVWWLLPGAIHPR